MRTRLMQSCCCSRDGETQEAVFRKHPDDKASPARRRSQFWAEEGMGERPAHAQEEPRTMQQRHVDDAVDDSFPASDPPAWTTTGSQSVAAQCEDTDSGDASMPGEEADSERAARSALKPISLALAIGKPSEPPETPLRSISWLG
jgi:hypothetical protein